MSDDLWCFLKTSNKFISPAFSLHLQFDLIIIIFFYYANFYKSVENKLNLYNYRNALALN